MPITKEVTTADWTSSRRLAAKDPAVAELISGKSIGFGMRALTIAVIACALAGRLIYLAWPFDSDGAMFIYLGKSVCDGDRFCHDVMDNKFPTVGLMTSIFWRLFGTHWAGYVFSQTTLAFAAAGFLARCAARSIGIHAGMPTLLAALVYLNFAPCVFGGFQLETLQAFFATICACASIECILSKQKSDAFLVGLAAGCAMLLKPTGAAPLAAFTIVPLLQRRNFSLLPPLLGGLLLPLAVGFIYLWHVDILADMPALTRQISDYANCTPVRWEDLLKPLVVLFFAGIGIVIRIWIFRRPAHRQGGWPNSSVALFTSLWFLFELLGAVAQRRMYAYHFLPLAPPAALLFGMLPRKNNPLQLLAALLPAGAVSVLAAVLMVRQSPPQAPRLALSDYVASHTLPTDSIWMDNAPRLLLETDRRLGARFPLMFVLGNTDDSAPADAATIINDFSERRPAMIILPSDVEKRIAHDQRQTLHLLRSPVRSAGYAQAWRAIAYYVDENYSPEIDIDEQTVWHRND